VDDVLLVQGSDALDDGSKSIDDFFFIEMDDAVAPFSIFDLNFESRLFLGVEQPVVVLDGFQECGVADVAFGVDIGVALKILIGLLGRFVE
jgi:hypothetical protein